MEWLRERQAAEHIGLSASTLSKLRCRGGGPVFVRRGRAILHSREDLDAWACEGRARSTTEADQRDGHRPRSRRRRLASTAHRAAVQSQDGEAAEERR